MIPIRRSVSILSLLPHLLAQAPARPYEPLPPPAGVAAPSGDAAAPGWSGKGGRAVPASPQTRVHFDRPQADGPLWALGTAWKASFDAQGFTAIPFFGSAAPRNFPVRFELAQATVGGESLALEGGEPVANGNQVRTHRGTLTEVVDASLDHLEQSFVFDALPNRGAITVDVLVSSELAASLLEDGIRFANEHGHLDYRKAVAVDAAGQRLPLAITWNGANARIEIPASFVAEAKLPIVLDPILYVFSGIAGGQSALQHDSDVASFQASGGRTLLIYQRNYSATDTDCWGVLFDTNLNVLQTDFIIDFTAANWTKVAVASNNFAQSFLVVSEVTAPGQSWIVGRTVAANAAVGAVFDIERDGIVGVPGLNFAPDVGGDPFPNSGFFCVVFTKRQAASSTVTDVYLKRVSAFGSLLGPSVLVDAWPNGVGKPSISKSCGQTNGLSAWWLITWQRTYGFAPFDQEVYGRYVSWSGALQGTLNFGIGVTVNEETAPSSGSPIDANGTRLWPVCYETAPSPGQPRHVLCKLLANNGGSMASFQVSSSLSVHDDREPEIDSDGTRFVIAWAHTDASSPAGLRAVTVAYLPSSNTFRIDESTGLGAQSPPGNSGQTNVCADFSGGNTPSARYFISFTDQNTNTFRLVNYGGWTPGGFYSYTGNQCGVTNLTVTGSPVLGQTMTFDVQPGPLAAVHVGIPAFFPLISLGCACYQAVDPIATFVAPWSWTIPNLTSAVGFSMAAQGFHITGSQCLGILDLSDTVNFTIH